MIVITRILGLVLSVSAIAIARTDLDEQGLKLLQDHGGWEYVRISLSDQDSGFQTEHVCFDGQPHPRDCAGRLTLSPSNTFVQEVSIRGQTVGRHGTYEIDGDQLSFFDEFGTRDGPYTFELNADDKWLVLSTPQVKLELELESQYKEDLQKKKAPRH